MGDFKKMMENLESLYKKAIWIAQEAHKGQTDKGGNPYIRWKTVK